ncbi:hypothetical protein [Rhizobium sp. LEGMi135b]
MLKEFGPDIWIADGPVVTAAAGFHYPTRMAVIRLTNGDLVLWSPVELTSDLRLAIEALGVVRHLVPPNSLHHTWLAEWRDAFPGRKSMRRQVCGRSVGISLLMTTFAVTHQFRPGQTRSIPPLSRETA